MKRDLRVLILKIKKDVKINISEKFKNFKKGDLNIGIEKDKIKIENKLYISPIIIKSRIITIKEVIVGDNFHWQHKEVQSFRGKIEIFLESDCLYFINIIPIEEYLVSVVGSEMKDICHIEFLKAQAVAARTAAISMAKENHINDKFDLCADDHCQDYRGILRETPKILKAVNDTLNEYIFYNNNIIDARFSKICGGISVKYSDCWSEKYSHPYYTELLDRKQNREQNTYTPENYILSKKDEFFCSPNLGIPKGFEYSKKYFRWEKNITQNIIKENFRKRKIKLGYITDIKIIKRTTSFRIVKLEIICGKEKYNIEGELNIRQILSESTLPSSAFILKKYKDNWKIFGAGWGHGVGLCQIGAAKMGELGYKYKDIINFYFPKTKIKKFGNAKKVDSIILEKKRPCYDIANCYELKKCIYGENGEGPIDCNGNPKTK